MDEPTVLELLAADDEAPPATLAAALAAIRATVAQDGVTVTVDLHGKLVGLVFDQRALRVRGAELAGRVRRLTARAAAEALDQGRARLGADRLGSLA